MNKSICLPIGFFYWEARDVTKKVQGMLNLLFPNGFDASLVTGLRGYFALWGRDLEGLI